MRQTTIGDRVEVHPNLHVHDAPCGYGVVVRHYIQTRNGDGWQDVYVVRLDDGRTVDAPIRFVSPTSSDQ